MNGAAVKEFETRFAEYVGAKYAIALCNGTATLHTALVALGVQPGDRVAVPPLTMSSTTIAVLHAGAVPVFVDVDPHTWLMQRDTPPSSMSPYNVGHPADRCAAYMPVWLYGLHGGWGNVAAYQQPVLGIADAAQTLGKHDERMAFTSYSFQASKILALGEGGMLVTNNETLATRAREFSSLGYRMQATQPRIDKDSIKASDAVRHYSLGWNYRMADAVAREGIDRMPLADFARRIRRERAEPYREAIQDVSWLTPQHVPEGWTHDYWTYAVACDTPERSNELVKLIVKYKGERPYSAWRISYFEPALAHLGRPGLCPVAESLQPRLLQFQTNDLASAERNARALRLAIEEIGA